jgi:hypothetical protein
MFSKSSPPAKALSFAIGFFLFSIYLLSFSGKFHVMDELAVFTVGHNLAQYGRADINQLIWTNHWTPTPPGIWGSDGNLYTKKPPGISFITAPLIALGHSIPDLNAVHVGLLTNALVTAITASLLFIWLLDLNFSPTTATFTALGYGLCTFAWVYARMFWESSLLALTFLIAIWSVYRANNPAYLRHQKLWLLLCGLAVAVSLTLRFEAAIAFLLIGLYLAASPRFNESAHQPPPCPTPQSGTSRWDVSRLTIYLVPSLLVGLGLLYFNFIRFGSLSETGYSQEMLFREPWVGAFGLLFSPGRGLFIYAPFLLLLFWGLRPAWRRLPRLYFWLIVTLCLSYWLFYGSWYAWGGAWGWGPRFLLPILPLLMVFVAEPIEEVTRSGRGGDAKRAKSELSISRPHASERSLPVGRFTPHILHFTFYVLVVFSLIINFLGIAVDFNEHFLRLGSNENFVFNWAAFPPLAHWRILQEGLVDVIWLRLNEGRLEIDGSVLLPALLLVFVAAVNLVVIYTGPREIRNGKLRKPFLFSYFLFLVLLAIALTYLMMRGTAQLGLADKQAPLDLSVLETLNTVTHSGDALLVPMPPFGDVQEISTRLMAYLDRPLPTYAWIESEPRAIQPAERERVWQAVRLNSRQAVGAEAKRVWLFERWLTQDDPPTPTAVYLNQIAFPVKEQWFERSGRLTLYALPDEALPISPTSLNVPFQGGLTLVDFALMGGPTTPGDILKVRLTWQAATVKDLAGQNLPVESITVFAQLLSETTGEKVAQTDRLLVDPQNFKQSPLLPGQTVQQGYGLQLPDDLPPGAYSLVVGLYQAGSGRRLPRADGSPDDFMYLTTVKVGD